MKNENEKIMLSEDDKNLSALLSVPSYKIGAYTIDVPKRMLTINGESTKLTTKESLLLILFAANANDFLDRKVALKMIWKDDNYYNSRSMDVYICKLRKLLKEDSNVYIINIHGKGYKMITPA
jgi:two-component system, OmpR family, response regulator